MQVDLQLELVEHVQGLVYIELDLLVRPVCKHVLGFFLGDVLVPLDEIAGDNVRLEPIDFMS